MEELLVVRLKSPKEEAIAKGINVELFATGTFSRPVRAWKNWRKADRYNLVPIKPVFRTSDGRCFTGAQFNKELKSLLGKYVDYNKHKFSSHSFQAGMASMMALAGYGEPKIMRQVLL